MKRDEVLDFFDRYRAAFDTLDGDAVADLWHVPCAIAGVHASAAHGQTTWWHEDAPMRDNMRALLQAFRTGYQLIRSAQGLRVMMCVAHDEDLAAMPSVAR